MWHGFHTTYINTFRLFWGNLVRKETHHSDIKMGPEDNTRVKKVIDNIRESVCFSPHPLHAYMYKCVCVWYSSYCSLCLFVFSIRWASVPERTDPRCVWLHRPDPECWTQRIFTQTKASTPNCKSGQLARLRESTSATFTTTSGTTFSREMAAAAFHRTF